MSQNNPSCFFCQSQTRAKYEIKKFSKPFLVQECPSCALQFQYPLPDPLTITEMYGPGYYTQENEFQYEDERKKIKYYSYVWDKRLAKLEKNIIAQNKPKILDIGCSFGGLLTTAEKRGWEGYGIEISNYAREYAKKNLPGRVFENLSQAGFKKDFFDAVSLIEVIEHLDQPLNTLTEIYSILKSGGVLLLQTANMEGRQAKKAGAEYHYYLPGHLFYFSKSNLEKILKKTGFKKVRFFHPVEFGLLPKLKKSRGFFKSWKDYGKWIKISWYHFKGLLHTKKTALTSSLVVYAWK